MLRTNLCETVTMEKEICASFVVGHSAHYKLRWKGIKFVGERHEQKVCSGCCQHVAPEYCNCSMSLFGIVIHLLLCLTY